MNTTRLIAGIALAAGLAVSGGAAQASIVQNCGTGDVGLTIGTTAYTPTSCANFVPASNSGTAETTAFNTAFGTSLIYLDKSDSAGSNGLALDGIRFTVTAPEATSGTWNISWVDTNGAAPANLPITIDLGIFLKAGSASAAGYLFEDVLIPESPTSGSGSFRITFFNSNGRSIPDLSHMTAMGARVADVPPPPPPPPPVNVPEPGSLALLGAGLLGLGAAIRRRRRTA